MAAAQGHKAIKGPPGGVAVAGEQCVVCVVCRGVFYQSSLGGLNNAITKMKWDDVRLKSKEQHAVEEKAMKEIALIDMELKMQLLINWTRLKDLGVVQHEIYKVFPLQ